MAGDLVGLQNDPQFKALPPERQQALLAEARRRAASPSGGAGYPAITTPSEAGRSLARGSYALAKGLFAPQSETEAGIQVALGLPEFLPLGMGYRALSYLNRLRKGAAAVKAAEPAIPTVEAIAENIERLEPETQAALSHAKQVESKVQRMLGRSEQLALEDQSGVIHLTDETVPRVATVRVPARGLSRGEATSGMTGETIFAQPEPATRTVPIQPSSRISQAPQYRRPLEPPTFTRPGLVRRTLQRPIVGSTLLGGTGGAVGSTLQGQGPVAGAKQGAVVGAGAGVLSAAASKAGSYFRERKLVDSGVQSFGTWLRGKFGDTKLYGDLVPSMKNATDFYREFGGAGALQQKLGRRVGDLNRVIADQFRNRLFEVPLPGGGSERVPFEDVPEYIRALEDRAWNANTGAALSTVGAGPGAPGARGAPLPASPGMGARQYRQLAKETLDTVAAQLDMVEPGVGYYWRQARRDYGGVKDLTRMLHRSGAFGGGEGIDWPEVQATIADNLHELRQSFGEDADNMLRASLRGAEPPGRDVSSRAGHMRLHPRLSEMGVVPSVSLPHAYKAVGRSPITVKPPPFLFAGPTERAYEEGTQ